MKFHITTMALAICVLAPASAQSQTEPQGQFNAQVAAALQDTSSTKTTVIPGKDNTFIVLRPEGRPVAVIDVNQDILGKSPKKSNDASRDAVADAKQGVHATSGSDAKDNASADAKSTVDGKTAVETTGKGPTTAVPAEAEALENSKSTANDDPKTLDKAQTSGSNSVSSAGGDCIKESWGAGKSQDKSANQPQANTGKKCD